MVQIVALSLGGTALVAVAAVVTATGHPPETAALAATGRALMVGIPFAVGLYAWRRGLRERFGVLLMLMAVLAAVTTLAESGNDVAYSSGRVAGWAFEVGLVYLVLSFPTGRLSDGVDRWLVGVAAGVAALLFLPTAALVEFYPEPSPYGTCDGDCPGNAFFLPDRSGGRGLAGASAARGVHRAPLHGGHPAVDAAHPRVPARRCAGP